jgi:hypothetical protein
VLQDLHEGHPVRQHLHRRVEDLPQGAGLRVLT